MTHLPGVPVKFDEPDEWRSAMGNHTGEPLPCRKCGAKDVKYRTHTASDGGVEDDEFKCFTCHHTWWVDGIDS